MGSDASTEHPSSLFPAQDIGGYVASPHVKDVTEEDFQTAVLQRSREVPVVVDFWAEWCGPCKVLGPLLESVAGDYGGAFALAKVDVDANQALSAQFRVQSIPTVVAFRDGKEVSRFTGAYPEQAVRQFVDAVLPTEVDLMVDQARTARIDGDATTAEHLFRQALAQTPDHIDAGTSLASLLIDRGETDEALIVLGKLAPDAEVERLQSAARLKASVGNDLTLLESRVSSEPDDDIARLEFAKALAGRSEYEPALDHFLVVVRNRAAGKEAARQAMVDIFGVLGDEHPLTAAYRKQLASALN